MPAPRQNNNNNNNNQHNDWMKQAINISSQYYKLLLKSPMLLRQWFDPKAVLQNYDNPKKYSSVEEISSMYLCNIQIPTTFRVIADGIIVNDKQCDDNTLSFKVYCHSVGINDTVDAKPNAFFEHNFVVRKYSPTCWKIVESQSKKTGTHAVYNANLEAAKAKKKQEEEEAAKRPPEPAKPNWYEMTPDFAAENGDDDLDDLVLPSSLPGQTAAATAEPNSPPPPSYNEAQHQQQQMTKPPPPAFDEFAQKQKEEEAKAAEAEATKKAEEEAAAAAAAAAEEAEKKRQEEAAAAAAAEEAEAAKKAEEEAAAAAAAEAEEAAKKAEEEKAAEAEPEQEEASGEKKPFSYAAALLGKNPPPAPKPAPKPVEEKKPVAEEKKKDEKKKEEKKAVAAPAVEKKEEKKAAAAAPVTPEKKKEEKKAVEQPAEEQKAPEQPPAPRVPAWGTKNTADLLRQAAAKPVVDAPVAVVAGGKEEQAAAKKKAAAAAEKEAAAAAKAAEAKAKKEDDGNLSGFVDHFDLFIRGLNESATADDVYEAFKKFGVAKNPIKLQRTPSKRDDSILTLCFCCFAADVPDSEKEKRATEMHDARIRVKGALARVDRAKDKEIFAQKK